MSGMPLNGTTDQDSLWKQWQLRHKKVDVIRTDWRGRSKTICLNGVWIKAELDTKEKKRCRLYLRHHANKLEIGAFMPPAEKPFLAVALNEAFARLRYDSKTAET